MNDSRVRSLTLEDIKELEKISRIGYALEQGSFWLTVESAITEENPAYEIHRCTCNLLLIVPRDYVLKCKKDFETENKVECWHKQGHIDSISSLNSYVKRRINHVVLVLKTNRFLAMQIAQGFIPTDNFTVFDYSLFRIEFALIGQEHYLGKKTGQSSHWQYLSELHKLFVSVNKKNPQEYHKLVDYYVENVKEFQQVTETAHSKINEGNNILADEAYKRITKAYTPSMRDITNSKDAALLLCHQIKLDGYQAYYESQYTLDALYNLILIEQGGSFTTDPFKKVKLNNGTPVKDSKEYMVQKIIESSSRKKLNSLLRQAFDNQLRNGTSGHNDYSINLKLKKLTIKKKGISYSLTKAYEIINRMMFFHHSLFSLLQVSQYDFKEKELSLLGFAHIGTGLSREEKPLPGMFAFQFWSNADLDKKGNFIQVLNMRLSKDRKYILFSPNEQMPKEGAKFPATKSFLEWAESVKSLNEIHYDRFIIAPKIEYFVNAAGKEIQIGGNSYFLIGNTHHRLLVNKPAIRKIIKILKNKHLPDDRVAYQKIDSIFQTVASYKDKKKEEAN